MFCPPEEESETTAKTSNNPRRRRKKKFTHNHKNAFKKELLKKKSRFVASMSSWAENFAIAATWQLKHQLAYWKARAIASEYENKVLHDIIRKNHIDPEVKQDVQSDSEVEEVPNEASHDYNELADDDEDEELEVSEEFIEFLRENAKYKESARQEREQLKAKAIAEENRITEQLEAGPSETPEDKQRDFKELYGDKWQRIAAVEMSVQSHFINECDIQKPIYWPNIPLNFNFS